MLKILEFMSHFPFRCGHQKLEYRLHLADTARSADAHLQPYGLSLSPGEYAGLHGISPYEWRIISAQGNKDF